MRGSGFGELLPLPFYRSIEHENVFIRSYGVRDERGLFGQAKMRADTRAILRIAENLKAKAGIRSRLPGFDGDAVGVDSDSEFKAMSLPLSIGKIEVRVLRG